MALYIDLDMSDDISSVREYYHVCHAVEDDSTPWDAYIIPKRGKDVENEIEWWMDETCSWFEMDIFVDRVKDKEHAIKISQDKLAEIKVIAEWMAKVWYGFYEEGDKEFDDQRS